MSENANNMEDYEISLPETVKRLRETRERMNLTVTQIHDMVKANPDAPSESTIRRILITDPLDTKFHRDYVDIIADALWGSSSIKFDTKKVRQYFEEANALRASAEVSARQIAEISTQLEHYKMLYEQAKDDINWLRRRVEFYEGRVNFLSRMNCPCFEEKIREQSDN